MHCHCTHNISQLPHPRALPLPSSVVRTRPCVTCRKRHRDAPALQCWCLFSAAFVHRHCIVGASLVQCLCTRTAMLVPLWCSVCVQALQCWCLFSAVFFVHSFQCRCIGLAVINRNFIKKKKTFSLALLPLNVPFLPKLSRWWISAFLLYIFFICTYR